MELFSFIFFKTRQICGLRFAACHLLHPILAERTLDYSSNMPKLWFQTLICVSLTPLITNLMFQTIIQFINSIHHADLTWSGKITSSRSLEKRIFMPGQPILFNSFIAVSQASWTRFRSSRHDLMIFTEPELGYRRYVKRI